MIKIKEIKQVITTQELVLFISFYVISTLTYYTATWITWGGLENANNSFFSLEEFFAAAGTDFIISFFITLPIWYITIISLKDYNYKSKIASHIIFLPLYLIACYYLQYIIKNFFGWAMFWGGKSTVWTFYNLMLFYLVQFALINACNYFKRYKQEEQEKIYLKELALNSEINALKAQLNPHFLHNLFNSINAIIPSDQERTREIIIQLSDLFRYQNYASLQDFVTIKEEIDFLTNYLDLMKLRLKEKLTYHFDIPAELNNFKIIPMLLQPLVENAVNHGIAKNIKPSILIIKMKKIEQNILISIEDTGIGFIDKNKALTKGIGLSHAKMRLRKIYNSELTIDDNTPSGTIISFKI